MPTPTLSLSLGLLALASLFPLDTVLRRYVEWKNLDMSQKYKQCQDCILCFKLPILRSYEVMKLFR